MYQVDIEELYGTVKAYEPKGELQAWCNSNSCRKPTKSTTAAYGTRKDVDLSKDWCPDCGSALFWIRANGRVDRRLCNKFSK